MSGVDGVAIAKVWVITFVRGGGLIERSKMPSLQVAGEVKEDEEKNSNNLQNVRPFLSRVRAVITGA